MKLSKHQHDFLLNWLQEQLELINEELAERKGEGRQNAKQLADATWLKRFLESGIRKVTREGTR